MTPFNRLAHTIGLAKGFMKLEPNPRPFSDADVMRARFARWLRQCHNSGMKVTDIIARLHNEPSDSDWLPGDEEPKRTKE